MRVIALESDRGLPGLRTRYADVELTEDIKGPGLIDAIVRVAERLDEKPVLFLTNDNMVRTVAQQFDRIEPTCRILWSDPRRILEMLSKDNLERLACAAGLRYPATHIISASGDLDRLPSTLSFPLALKPASPLSPFKALKVNDHAELKRNVERYESKIDCFLAQEWITGSDRSIHFVSLYFDRNGKNLASFVGRKIRAFPLHTGGASSAEPTDRADLIPVAERFFDQAPVRGPVSLEVKEDDNGVKYVIEPTVGRFDFWVKCCMVNGVDYPLIAYADQTGEPVVPSTAARKTVWIDFEKDLISLLDSLREGEPWTEVPRFLTCRKAFALWTLDDVMPSLAAWPVGARRHAQRVLARLTGS